MKVWQKYEIKEVQYGWLLIDKSLFSEEEAWTTHVCPTKKRLFILLQELIAESEKADRAEACRGGSNGD